MPLIWVKDNPQPSYKKTSFRSGYEMGLWLINDGAKYAQPRTFLYSKYRSLLSLFTTA